MRRESIGSEEHVDGENPFPGGAAELAHRLPLLHHLLTYVLLLAFRPHNINCLENISHNTLQEINAKIMEMHLLVHLMPAFCSQDIEYLEIFRGAINLDFGWCDSKLSLQEIQSRCETIFNLTWHLK